MLLRNTTINETLADLLQHGLWKASYIPDRKQRELRELVSYRKSLVQEKSRELNRLQKMLEGANIKLSGTLSNINGKSGRKILEELVTGNKLDGRRLEELIDGRLKADRKQILEDIQGVISPLQRKMMKEMLKHIKELDTHIKALDDDIDANMGGEYKTAIEAVDEITGIGRDGAKAILA